MGGRSETRDGQRIDKGHHSPPLLSSLVGMHLSFFFSSSPILNPPLLFLPGFLARPRPSTKVQVYRTLYHLIHLSLAYIIMLVVMTYNMGLCLAVVFGSAVAFFCFSPFGSGLTGDCH